MTLPVKPQLPSLKTNAEGGISLDKRDSAELGKYIFALENTIKE